MSKKKFFIILIILCGCFFLLQENCASAQDIIISEYPVSSEIVYGHPLFSSSLVGGSSNVEGFFSWKEESKVLGVGNHKEIVVFTSVSGEKEEIEVDVSVLPKRVYIEFQKEMKKQYDGNDYIDNIEYIVKGIIDSSVYVKGKISIKLDSVFVGENIGVSIKGLELSGEGKDNYYFDLEGFTATIHPKYLDKFGSEKNRVDFSESIYIPVNSLLNINDSDLELNIDKYDVKKVIDIGVFSQGKKLNIAEKVFVKLNIDNNDLDYKRITLYNYYNGKYEELEYQYLNGELSYWCTGLGYLVVASKEYNYIWLYILCSIIILSLVIVLVYVQRKRYNRIKHYKSIRRRKDYGNYL